MSRLAACSSSRLAYWYFAVSLTVTVASASQASHAPGGGSSTPVAPPPAANGVPFVIQPPILDAHARSISADSIVIAGSARDAFRVEVSGPDGLVSVPVANERFTATLPVGIVLGANRVNSLYFTAIAPTFDRQRSAPATTHVTHDLVPPNLFIDFPLPGAELTTDAVDVMGRVGDLLSGHAGLTVVVNGQPAAVSLGTGNNGTFVRLSVPLALGRNTIDALASDALGNSQTRSIHVTRIQIPAGSPRMEVVSGNGQSAMAGNELALPIRVRVLRGDGSPFEGKVVSFHATRNDGRLAATPGASDGAMLYQTLADANGYAQAWWRLGGAAGVGSNRVEVLSTDVLGSVFFCASGTPGVADQINIGSGNNQRAEVGTFAPEPLRAWVSDSCNPVAGIPVTFTVVQGGGLLNGATQATVASGPTGHAEVVLQLGTTPGPNVIEADFTGNPTNHAVFTVYGLARDLAEGTRFRGVVFDNAMQPIGGALCTLVMPGRPPQVTTTSEQGQFRFTDVPSSGPADLLVDGSIATLLNGQTIPTGSFPTLHYTPVLIANAENGLGMPVLLPRLNPNNWKYYSTTQPTELTCEGMDGLKMIIAPGSMRMPSTYGGHALMDAPDNTPVSLNQVHHDDVPMPMPDGAAPPFAWTVQPAGAHFDPPIRIEYPNMSGLPAGALANFLSFDHDTGRFEIVSSAHVSDDGATIHSDNGQGLAVSGWGCNCPPYSVTADCEDECPLEPCASGGGAAVGTSTNCSCALSCSCNPIATATALSVYAGWLLYADAVAIWTSAQGGCGANAVFLNHLLHWRGGTGAPVIWGPDPCTDQNLLHDRGFRRLRANARLWLHALVQEAVASDPGSSGVAPQTRTVQQLGLGSLVLALADLNAGVHGVETGNSTVTVTASIDPPGSTTYVGAVVITLRDTFGWDCGDPQATFGTYLEMCGLARPFPVEIWHSDCYSADVTAATTIHGPIGAVLCAGAAAELVGDDETIEARETRVTLRLGSSAREITSATGFAIQNVSAADAFGADGPGTAPDFRSDDAVVGVIYYDSDPPLFMHSDPFFLRQGAPNQYPEWHFSTTPPLLPDHVCIRRNSGACDDSDSSPPIDVGQTTQLHVVAVQSDGSEVDASASASGTTYRTSNPRVAGVDANGVVAGASPGPAFITAVNGSATSVLRVDVTAATVMTTVRGFVALADGSAVPGAIVMTSQGSQATSAADGSFEFPAVLPIRVSTVVVTGSATLGGIPHVGATSPVEVLAGGFTDVGVIVLTPICTGSIFPHAVFATGANPASVATADIDQDGDVDAVVSNTASGTISVLRNRGNATFDTQATFAVGTSPRSATIADLDGDGMQDIAVAQGTNGVTLLRGTGAGNFAPLGTLVVGLTPNSIRAADLDGDGDLDLVTANTGTGANTVSILRNDGTGTFAPQVAYFAGPVPWQVAVANLDGDGDLDLAVTNQNGVAVLLNNGNGTFAPQATYLAGFRPLAIGWGDLDGDGDADLAVANDSTISADTVTLLLNTGSGSFVQMATGLALDFPTAIVVKDADADGDRDIVVGSRGGPFVAVLRNQGNATFAVTGIGDPGGVPIDLSLDDFDGDGDEDLAVVDQPNSALGLFLGSGDGTFEAPGLVSIGASPSSVALSDMNGDGELDLVTAADLGSLVGTGGVSIARGLGNGSFARPASSAAIYQPSELRLADLNADSYDDAVVLASGGGAVAVLMNLRNGTFAMPVEYSLSDYSFALAIGDVDGDGDVDIAVGGEAGTKNPPGVVNLLFNQGSGTFVAGSVTYFTADAPQSMVLRDLDADLDLDLVLAWNAFLAPGGGVRVLRNLGGGNFGAQAAYSTGGIPNSIAVADVDGDLDLDLVAGNGGGTVGILLNTGAGSFTNAAVFPAGSILSEVATGDFDGDGVIDVVAANSAVFGGGTRSVSLLRGLGDGTFAPRSAFGVGGGPVSVAAGDVNHDGNLDLVVANAESYTVSVLLNRCR